MIRSFRQDGRFCIDGAWRVLLADLDLRPDDALRLAGLPPSLLHDLPVRLPPDDFFRLWQALEQLSAPHALPVRAARALRGDAFSPLVFAALCSRNFLQAVDRVTRYKALTAPLLLDVRSVSRRVTITLRALDLPSLPASFGIAELLFLVALARLATRSPVPVLRLTAPVVPPQQLEYAEYLGVAPERGPQFTLTIGADDGARPFLTNDDALWAAFEPDLRRRLSNLGGGTTFTERVHAVLLEALPGGIADIPHVASTLAVSPRSLQRLLEQEGTSFAQALREVRESLARHYLERTTLSLQEISFLLGFGQPASFSRAFRTWTGHTPMAVRTAMHDGHERR